MVVFCVCMSVCPVEGEVYLVHAIDDFVIDVSAGTGGLCAAPLASTNITQSFSMNGLVHCGTASSR